MPMYIHIIYLYTYYRSSLAHVRLAHRYVSIRARPKTTYILYTYIYI